jgi:two-component sensor histidine kinase
VQKFDEYAEPVQLAEARHRLTNSFQMLAALIRMKLADARSDETRGSLNWLENAVISMGLLQKRLSTPGGGQFSVFLCDATALWQQLAFDRGIVVRYAPDAAGDLEVSTTKSGPVALVVHELLTNCFKHAFPEGTSGEITICLKRTGDGDAELKVVDNGIGFNGDQGAGSGLALIKRLTRLIDGTFSVERGEGGGTVAKIVFHPGLAAAVGMGGTAQTGPAQDAISRDNCVLRTLSRRGPDPPIRHECGGERETETPCRSLDHKAGRVDTPEPIIEIELGALPVGQRNVARVTPVKGAACAFSLRLALQQILRADIGARAHRRDPPVQPVDMSVVEDPGLVKFEEPVVPLAFCGDRHPALQTAERAQNDAPALELSSQELFRNKRRPCIGEIADFHEGNSKASSCWRLAFHELTQVNVRECGVWDGGLRPGPHARA